MAFGFIEVSHGDQKFCLNTATVIYVTPRLDSKRRPVGTAILLRNVSDAATPMAGGQIVVDQPYEDVSRMLMTGGDPDPYAGAKK
jgi:hypothetical protein